MSKLTLNTKTQLITTQDSSTISVLWDRAVQQAVINTTVGPTIAARAYSMMHTVAKDRFFFWRITPKFRNPNRPNETTKHIF